MSEFEKMTNDELMTVCKTRFCCESMAENVFYGDVITKDDFIGLRINDGFWRIKFCPWCSHRVRDMIFEKDLIDFLVEKNKKENECE